MTATQTYTEIIVVRPKALFWSLGLATALSVGLPLLLSVNDPENMPVWLLVVNAALMAGLWWLMMVSRIKLIMNAKGVYYQFWPFGKKFVGWQELEACYPRKLNAFSEFGGWGMRWGFVGKSWGYVTNSDYCLQLVYKSKRRVAISTFRPEEVSAWLEAYAPANKLVVR